MKSIITGVLIAWALWEHDRRVRLEAFARLALPLVADEMQRRGWPVGSQAQTAANEFRGLWQACSCGGACSACQQSGGQAREVAADVFNLYAT